MKKRKIEATQVVTAVRMEHGHGLLRRDGRDRGWASGDDSIGSRCEANGIMTEEDLESDMARVGDATDAGDLHILEFLERGVDAPALSRRSSKLVPVRATCGRDFSGESATLGP